MGEKVMKSNQYYKIFLFEEECIFNNKQVPAAVLELFSRDMGWVIRGEVLDERIRPERMQLGLKVTSLEGTEHFVGQFRTYKAAPGKLNLRTRALALIDTYSRVCLCEKTRSPEGQWKTLFSVVLEPSTLMDEPKAEDTAVISHDYGSPGEYLWDSRVAREFPLLLEQVMEKVEAITDKVSTLEKRRAQKHSPPSGIKQVEPFAPPLTNYRWWQLR